MKLAITMKYFNVSCLILSSVLSATNARLAGAPEIIIPGDVADEIPEENTEDTLCYDLSMGVVMRHTTCFDDASASFLDSKLSLVSPASADIDVAEMKQLRKKAKKNFKKANKKCSKKLQKKLTRLQNEEDCQTIEPAKVTETILICAMDEIPYVLCAEEVETILTPPVNDLPDLPTGRADDDDNVCCKIEEEPGVGITPQCPNGKPPKCCPNGGGWGCGTETEGDYLCGLDVISMNGAELGVRCNNFCPPGLQIECPPGSGRYVSPDPSNGCKLDCPLPPFP